MRQFRLERALDSDARWVCSLLNQLGERFGTVTKLEEDGSLRVEFR